MHSHLALKSFEQVMTRLKNIFREPAYRDFIGAKLDDMSNFS